MPHVNRRIPDLGHNKLGTEEWDTDYVVKKGATDPFKIRKHANADLQSLLNMPAIAPLKFPFQMGWQGIETLLPKKKQYTTIELNTAKEGDFSATFEDSKEATREARLNQAKGGKEDLSPKEGPLGRWGPRVDAVTGDLVAIGSGENLGVNVKDLEKDTKEQTSQLLTKTTKAPTGPNFTNAEKFAYNKQAAGKGSVAKNRAMLKQWQFEQDQQKSVAGALGNTTSQPTDITKDPPNAQVQGKMNLDLSGLDKDSATRVGNMQTMINQASPARLEQLRNNPAMAEDMLRDAGKGIGIEQAGGMSAGGAMAVNAGVKIAQAILADKDKKIAQQNKEALATAKLGASTDRQSQLTWLKEDEPSWMAWV